VVTVRVCDVPVPPLTGNVHPTPVGEPTTVQDKVNVPEKLFTACSEIESVTFEPAFTDTAALVGCNAKSFTERVTFVLRLTPSPLPVRAMVAFAAGVLPAVVWRVTTD
jgi:hypothetical protein